MKTDSIFYQLFQTLPSLLFELLDSPTERAENYEFISVELKELSKTIDGLFNPIINNPDYPIYFVEVQFQKDNTLYDRLMMESSLYLGQYQPEKTWLMVAIWAKRSLDTGVPLRYQRLQQSGLLRVIYLNEITDKTSLGLNIIQLILAPTSQVQSNVQELFPQTEQIADEQLRRQVVELIDKIIIYKFPHLSTKELETMFSLTEWQKTRFYQDVYSDGEIEGKIEGKTEGKIESKIEVISRLFKKGFKPKEIAEIVDLPLTTVQQEIKKLRSSN
ncbi:MAG TPA: Rpn family recombination-promoting nuclease/putative transposase [Allocoleopsis sp.]